MTEIDAYLDDELSADARAAWARELRAQPEALDRVVDELALVSRLRAQRAIGEAEVMAIASRSRAQPPTRRHRAGGRRRHRRRGSPTALLLSLATVVLLLIGLLSFWPDRPPAVDPVQSAVPIGAVQPGGDLWIQRQGVRLDSWSALRVGDRLVNGAPHSTTVAMDAGDRIQVMANTALAFTTAVDWRLQRGTISVTAVERPAAAPLRCHTHDLSVRVVGTRFTLSTDGTSSTIAVHEGQVAASVGQAAERLLSAGEQLRSSDATSSPTLPLLPLDSPWWTRGRLATVDGRQARIAERDDTSQNIKHGVALSRPDGEAILQLTADSIVHLRYRLDEAVPHLRVQCFLPGLDDNIHHVIEQPLVGAWTTIQLPIADFIPNAAGTSDTYTGQSVRLIQVYTLDGSQSLAVAEIGIGAP